MPSGNGKTPERFPEKPTFLSNEPIPKPYWRPTAAMAKYVKAAIDLGFDATDKELAKQAGVTAPMMIKWRQNQKFMVWMNHEVMRRLTAKVPGRALYAIDAWLQKKIRDIHLYEETGGQMGKYPTTSDIRQMIELADRFGMSGMLPKSVDEKRDKGFTIKIVTEDRGEAAVEINEDNMIIDAEVIE